MALGLNRIGKKAIVALREPSLGPVFGMKGGAAGGGYSQVLPMENINLHFTGDFHAITSAHNTISALLDNYIYQSDSPKRLKEVVWKRVLDVNDRNLRYVVTGLNGATNGFTQESGFDITPASELMAILCLAENLEDLRRRIENITLAYTTEGEPFTVKDLGIAGAITVLLKDAVNPNLVQTTEKSAADVAVLLDATQTMFHRYARQPLITMAMGKLGAVSRLAGETFGSAITFGSAGKPSAPGQIDSNDLHFILDILSGHTPE